MQESGKETTKGKEHDANRTMASVNITQLSSEQMRKVKQGLKNFFANEINPMRAKFKPEPGVWEA
jgi:hypothetical protein